MAELKLYQCHKRVHARPMNDHEYLRYKNPDVNFEMTLSPQPGYLVIYNKDTTDHYESWSPKHVFEEGYTEVPDVVRG